MRKRGKEARKKKSKKGAIELETLAWWLIAVAVLVLALAAYLIFSGKGAGIIQRIINLFRFGR